MSSLSSGALWEFRRHGAVAFVETGCYLGDGIAAALEAGFEKVRSCDIAPNHVRRCRARFAGDPRVQVVEGDSLQALESILPEDFGPALFWLDAHFPAFYGLNDLEDETTRFPVPEELALIHRLRRGEPSDVILVDDIRVVDALDNPRWRDGENPEYFVTRGLTLAGLTDAYRAIHEWRVEGAEEGILVLTPLKGR